MLTGKQKRHLRTIGHKLKPVVQIGKREIEDSLVSEVRAALDHHELIKIRLLESCLFERHEAADILAEACSAEVTQVLGKTFLLYKPADKPVITLPKTGKTAPMRTI